MKTILVTRCAGAQLIEMPVLSIFHAGILEKIGKEGRDHIIKDYRKDLVLDKLIKKNLDFINFKKYIM
jgi:hypothetical protein